MSGGHPATLMPAPLLPIVASTPQPAAAAAMHPQAASDQRILILQKSVHPSERQWSRLVVPGAQVHFFQAIQAELKALGKDINLYIKDSGPNPRIWRWLFRMTVQRPMVLDMQPFYLHNGVNAGDTVCLYRNVATNDLTVEVLRGAGLPPLPPGTNGTEAAAAAAAAAALGPQPQPQEPVPTFASGQLPGLAWTLGPRGGKRTGGPAACGPGCSPAPAEEDDEYWAAGADDGSDGDYSPTAKGRGGKRSAAAAKGPMAVRRALNKQRSGSSDGSDQEGTYTAKQMARFDALVDVAARLAHPKELHC